MTIGEEKDIREFNDVLLSRIRNAFDSKRQEQEEESKVQANAQAPEILDDKPVQPEGNQENPIDKGPSLGHQSSFMEAEKPASEEIKDVPMESSNQEVEKEDAIDSTFIGKVK